MDGGGGDEGEMEGGEEGRGTGHAAKPKPMPMEAIDSRDSLTARQPHVAEATGAVDVGPGA